jgi:N-dimethylarginine dimethylaminohydrolase
MMGLNEFGSLREVAVKHAREAFGDSSALERQWRGLNYTAPPDVARAVVEHDAFVQILRAAGADVRFLPADDSTTIDSIYVRDASIVSPRGLIFCSMGKVERASEPAAQERAFSTSPALTVAGRIAPPGTLEGGDLLWLDPETVAVGHGYRTNAEGIRQLRALLGSSVTVVDVPLPHWRGDRDVMHLMSLISPVDRDLAVVYSPLMPVPFRQWLLARGLTLVEVPDGEFDSMGTNVLALAPRRCLMVSGNPQTRARLEAAGATVIEYDGREISVKGAGGPTCLTRPLARDVD